MGGWRFSGAIFAAVLTIGAGTALAQRGGVGNETAAQNVRESEAYERLVCSNSSFRAKRIAQECGPITDPQLHQSCVASFQCDRPHKPVRYRHAPPSETIR